MGPLIGLLLVGGKHTTFRERENKTSKELKQAGKGERLKGRVQWPREGKSSKVFIFIV